MIRCCLFGLAASVGVALSEAPTCSDESSLLQTSVQTHLIDTGLSHVVAKPVFLDSHHVDTSTDLTGHVALKEDGRNWSVDIGRNGTTTTTPHNMTPEEKAIWKQEEDQKEKDIIEDVERAVAQEFLSPEEVTHLKSVHSVIPFCCIFLFSTAMGTLLASWQCTKMIPDSAVVMIVSVIVGFLFLHLHVVQIDFWNFSKLFCQLLELGLLPIIVFNGGWELDRVAFFQQFEHILIFAIGGTAITILAIGYASWFAANYIGLHGVTDFRTNMAFGALIASTDPVATLATYAKLKMPKRAPFLSAMVSGESLINDAVAIVVFSAINQAGEKIEMPKLFSRIGFLFVCSIVYGTACACLLLVLMRMARLAGHVKPQILFTLASAYLIYCSADAVGLSGIIANVWAGVSFRRYGSKLLSIEGEFVATEIFDVAATIADNIIFIFCGLCLGILKTDRSIPIEFGFFTTLLCVAARGLITPLCSFVSNSLRACTDGSSDHAEGSDQLSLGGSTRFVYITWKDQVIIWLGGLRGGIALLCALKLDEQWCKTHDKVQIVQWTLTSVVVLLLTFGVATEHALRGLGIVSNDGKGDREPEFGSEEWKEIYDKAEIHPREFGRNFWMRLYPFIVGEAHESRKHGLEANVR
mmetsp:Transcript_59298/g.94129  ORF Transcript_59298/g.94129 Transcript_59298/m.94129 type:complete len:639 (-) Transcript_59298:71-1987(-)